MTRRYVPWNASHPLAQPRYMTPEQVADLVERARANGRAHEVTQRQLASKRRDHLCGGCMQRGHFRDECPNKEGAR